jgi:hypothetical protein
MSAIPVLPTDEQQHRARWDLLLLGLEHRAEQIGQLKAYEGRRLVIQQSRLRRLCLPRVAWSAG